MLFPKGFSQIGSSYILVERQSASSLLSVHCRVRNASRTHLHATSQNIFDSVMARACSSVLVLLSQKTFRWRPVELMLSSCCWLSSHQNLAAAPKTKLCTGVWVHKSCFKSYKKKLIGSWKAGRKFLFYVKVNEAYSGSAKVINETKSFILLERVDVPWLLQKKRKKKTLNGDVLEFKGVRFVWFSWFSRTPYRQSTYRTINQYV